tara:strand:- start:955 stop:1119 length:165 start_codon:yes stop_codon:yes gene_type:complete
MPSPAQQIANLRRTHNVVRALPKKSSTDGGSNVEKFDEPASRRGTKTGKVRVKK